MIDPRAIESVVPLFEAGVARVHFRMRTVDAQGAACGGAIPYLLSDNRAAQSLRKSGYLYASPPASGNVYSRSALERLMPIPVVADDRGGADFGLIYGAGLFGEIRAHPDVLGSYRVHAASESGSLGELVFGNSSRYGDERERRARRAARFVALIEERTFGAIRLPGRLIDFSQEKEHFGLRVMQSASYAERLRSGFAGARDYFVALRLLPNASWRFKVIAALWAVAIVVLPRRLAHRVCRYGSNPGTRRPNPVEQASLRP